jgi:hypothetical protein
MYVCACQICLRLYVHVYTYIYIYIYVCVCVYRTLGIIIITVIVCARGEKGVQRHEVVAQCVVCAVVAVGAYVWPRGLTLACPSGLVTDWLACDQRTAGVVYSGKCARAGYHRHKHGNGSRGTACHCPPFFQVRRGLTENIWYTNGAISMYNNIYGYVSPEPVTRSVKFF